MCRKQTRVWARYQLHDRAAVLSVLRCCRPLQALQGSRLLCCLLSTCLPARRADMLGLLRCCLSSTAAWAPARLADVLTCCAACWLQVGVQHCAGH